MRYEIKQLGVGGILDESIKLLKNHFGLLFGILLVLYVPYGLIANIALAWLAPDVPDFPTPEEQAVVQRQLAIFMLATAPISLIGLFLITPLTNAAVIHAVSCEYLEIPTSVGDSIKRSFQLLLPMIWVTFLVGVCTIGGLFLCIIPGVVFFFRYFLSTEVLVIEGIGGWGALQRSKTLMLSDRSRHYNTIFLVLLLIGVIQMAVGQSTALIPNQWIQIVASVLVSAVLYAFGAVASVVFYFSCRCTADNFDLARLAEEVGAEPPAPATKDPGVFGFEEPGR